MAGVPSRPLALRKRYARATRHGLVLLGLLVIVSAVERLQTIAVGYAAYRADGDLGYRLREIIYVVSLVTGGVAVDRLGVVRAVFLSLVLWSGVTTLNASLLESLNRLIMQEFFGFLVLGPVFVAGYVAITRAFHPRRRAVASMTYQTFPFLWPVVLRPSWGLLGRADGGATPLMLGLGTAAIAIALLWGIVTSRLAPGDTTEPQGADQRPIGAAVGAFFAQRETWALVLLVACSMIAASRAFRLMVPPVQTSVAATYDVEIILFRVGAIVAALAVAAWSDRICRQVRAFGPARLPLIAAGFAGVAAIGLLPIVATETRNALVALVLSAALVTQLTLVLSVDHAPKTGAGLFFGLLIATAYGLQSLVYQAEAWIGGTQTTTVAIVALVGASTALFLWRRMPERPASSGPTA